MYTTGNLVLCGVADSLCCTAETNIVKQLYLKKTPKPYHFM